MLVQFVVESFLSFKDETVFSMRAPPGETSVVIDVPGFVEELMAMASGAMSQLIFTTHDTNLLNGRLLPPGSICFVEKDDYGASHLHSLAEYRAPQLGHLLEHLEKGYLQRRFGAIPFLAHRYNPGWQSEDPAA